MKSLVKKKVLVSGASFAGLSTAYWMKKQGFEVTVIEIAQGLKKGGTPVNIRGKTVDIVKRMGLFAQVQANRLEMKVTEVKSHADVGKDSSWDKNDSVQLADDDYEIERDVLLNLMFDACRDDVEFIFGDSIGSLNEVSNSIEVLFNRGVKRSFDLVFGCDGARSDVRKLWFGAEEEFSHFLQAYGSVTIVDKLLIPENTVQMQNKPGKMVVLSAYNGRTDIILIFYSEKEIAYDHHDKKEKRKLVISQFSEANLLSRDILLEVEGAENFYFDRLNQIKMASWTKGRVALVGDAGYCASPAAGMGGSLAIVGAAALGDAFEKCDGDFELAFAEYNLSLVSFVEEVQENAVRFCSEFLDQKYLDGDLVQ